MVKLSLAFVAVMTISILMGSSMGTVDAKPYSETVDECEDRQNGVCPISFTQKCGVFGVFGYESRIDTTTFYDEALKFKTVSSRTGELYDSANVLVATYDRTVTTTDFFEDVDKGAKVVKMKFKIDCVNGEKETNEITVTVTHPDNRK
jgi:hypothetical protein